MIKSSCSITLDMKFSDEYRSRIMNLADEMAAASTQKDAHSYDNLIRARKMLESELMKKVLSTIEI